MIFSIGHGGLKASDELLALLKRHKVTLLIDIRTKPFSRWQPEFNRTTSGPKMGTRYTWLGDVLGGLGPPITKAALERLVRMGENERVAIMCSEGHPSKCHRHGIIGKRLLEREIEVHHILKDGSILSSVDMEAGTPGKKKSGPDAIDKARAKQAELPIQQKLF